MTTVMKGVMKGWIKRAKKGDGDGEGDGDDDDDDDDDDADG